MFACSKAAAARRNRSRTFSTARIILSQETSPIGPGGLLRGAEALELVWALMPAVSIVERITQKVPAPRPEYIVAEHLALAHVDYRPDSIEGKTEPVTAEAP